MSYLLFIVFVYFYLLFMLFYLYDVGRVSFCIGLSGSHCKGGPEEEVVSQLSTCVGLRHRLWIAGSHGSKSWSQQCGGL